MIHTHFSVFGNGSDLARWLPALPHLLKVWLRLELDLAGASMSNVESERLKRASKKPDPSRAAPPPRKGRELFRRGKRCRLEGSSLVTTGCCRRRRLGQTSVICQPKKGGGWEFAFLGAVFERNSIFWKSTRLCYVPSKMTPKCRSAVVSWIAGKWRLTTISLAAWSLGCLVAWLPVVEAKTIFKFNRYALLACFTVLSCRRASGWQ